MTDNSILSPPPRYPRASCNLSVVLCTRNGERWVGEQLQSLATQLALPDELIVQDDCSEDRTCEIVREFSRSAPFDVSLVVNDRNLGSTHNFEAALNRCHGRFVALADQDDIWYPHKLERLVGELELDPTVTMVFSDADLVDESGSPLGRRLWDTRLIGRTLRRRAVVPEHLFARRALTTGCTMMVRRRAVAASLPFPDLLGDESAVMRHDRWVSLIAATVGTVRALPEPLLAFRVHPAQETGVLVGRQLASAMGRAFWDVMTGAGMGDSAGRRTRASQLEIAADRADDLGDFEEAETLRGVAAHLRRRADDSRSSAARLRVVSDDLRAGAYGWDRIGLAAAAADTVRAVLRHPRGQSRDLRS